MTDDASTMAPSSGLSPEAEAFINAVGAATNLPAFVRNVRAISSVASNLDARVAQLESAIVQDVALSAKVLRIANSVSMGGGSGGAPAVSSVKQAIMLLGYDRVQHLSTATSVFGKIEQDAPAVRDLLVEAVLSATHGLHLSIAAGFEKPELAYLCALFHRLGEVLVACYRPRQYRAWVQMLHDGHPSHEGAEADEFGFTFEEVGVALARKWGMPDDVVRSMYVCREITSATDTLRAITQYSSDITRSVHGSTPSPHNAVELRARYARAIGVDVKTMEELGEAVMTDAKPTLEGMQVDLGQWLTEQAGVIEQQRQQRTPPDDGDDGQHVTEPVATDSPVEAKLRDVMRDLVQQKRSSSAVFDVGAVASTALGAACEAGFESGVLGICSEDFKFIRGRVGIGRNGQELTRQFLLRPHSTFGPLGAALQAHTNVFASLAGSEGKAYARDRLIKERAPAHFALLPLVVEDKLVGCLYFESRTDTIVMTDTVRELLCGLRDQLAVAFARRRAQAAGAA